MLPYDQRVICKPIAIAPNCWIDSKVIILPGVTVNEGAVIGAGSVIIAVLKITAYNHTHENIPYNPTHGSPQMLLQRPLIKALLHGLFVFSYMP